MNQIKITYRGVTKLMAVLVLDARDVVAIVDDVNVSGWYTGETVDGDGIAIKADSIVGLTDET